MKHVVERNSKGGKVYAAGVCFAGINYHVGTFGNPERASVAARIFKHWLGAGHHESSIPRRPENKERKIMKSEKYNPSAEEKQALIEHCELLKCASDPVYGDIAEIALAALTAQQDDTKRMDWLVSKTVNVREPLLYGSHNIFWSQAVTDEEDDHHATLLREQIDAAITSEVQE